MRMGRLSRGDIQTKQISADLVSEPAEDAGSCGYDCLAPDGSEIRLLLARKGGSLVHCSLAEGRASAPVRHRTVEELWYFIEGQGEVWRRAPGAPAGEVTPVQPGTALDLPLGTHFQFRNTGTQPLRFIILTMPPWPGDEEAVSVDGIW